LKELLHDSNERKNIKSSSENLLLEIFDPDVCSKKWQKGNQSNKSLFTIDTAPKTKDYLDVPMYSKVGFSIRIIKRCLTLVNVGYTN
jgi:hypothetical protein